MTNIFGTTASYACLGCIDLVNDARTKAYHENACAENLYECDTHIQWRDECSCIFDGVVGDYTNPAEDGACWYDADVPESAEFLGVIITNISGLIDSRFESSLIDSTNNMSALQQGLKRGRELVLEVALLSTSCAGMAFGVNWVNRILEGRSCSVSGQCSSCIGKRFKIRVHCDADASDSGIREFTSVGTLAGLVIDDDTPEDACCCLKTGTITLGTESANSYDEEELACEVTANPEAYEACIEWRTHCIVCSNNPCATCKDCNTALDTCEGCVEACGPCDRCFSDPQCATGLKSITRPTFRGSECFCEPVIKIIQCCEVTDIPNQIDTTLKIELYSGFDLDTDYHEYGLRNVKIKIFQNPQGLPPITDDASYELWRFRKPCASLELSYVPADATLTIDGTLEQVFLNCDGVCRPFNQAASSALGGSVFPLIVNCHDLMVCVEWDAFNTSFSGLLGSYGFGLYGDGTYGPSSSATSAAPASFRVLKHRTYV